MLLYGSKFWPVVTGDVPRLVTADNGMTKWICDVSLKDRIPTTDLSLCLGISSINEMRHWNRLRFHEHLLRIDDNARPKKPTMHYVDGSQPRDGPRNRLCDVIRVDMKSLNLSNEVASKSAVLRRAIKPN